MLAAAIGRSGPLEPAALAAALVQGEAPAEMTLPRVTLFFKLTASQQADLDQLLDELQDRSSPNYHKWLTSDQFAGRFGVSQADMAKVVAWTQGRGLRMLVERLGVDSAGPLERYLLADQNYYLPDDILYKTDRMSMAHSLEVRPPFLDHRIVEFAARLPEKLKIRNSTLKAVLRHLMRDKLPPHVLKRKKEGFDIPAHDWLRGPLRGLLLDTLTRDAVIQSNLFDWNVIERLIAQHMDRRANVGYHLWGLLTLLLWMKKWNICQSESTLSLTAAAGF